MEGTLHQDTLCFTITVVLCVVMVWRSRCGYVRGTLWWYLCVLGKVRKGGSAGYKRKQRVP